MWNRICLALAVASQVVALVLIFRNMVFASLCFSVASAAWYANANTSTATEQE